ncbi:protein Ltv1p [Trichomonascus vanleenenianus]|uniref:ribosome biogenesis protein LTV1 n=1 Tax=Trichomonascus vanleenenianus TaxID=2268995 RepID=UPI003EC9FB33
MAPRKWIDKKKADTYVLVHRSQEDARYNDTDAPDRVLVKVDNLNDADKKAERRNKHGPTTGGKVLTAADLEQSSVLQGRRENEGEAALYGITYDDSKYDYMQHLKPIGSDPNAIFIARKDLEKPAAKKGGSFLKDGVALPEDVLPSQEKRKLTYQDQQNIPDQIAGLQPDMPEELRETLEALDDEAYVDNVEDDDLFSELVKGGEVEEDEWDEFDPDNYYEDELDGYDSDDTVKGASGRKMPPRSVIQPKEGEEEWETAFRQFKLDEARKGRADDSDDEFASEAGDGLGPMSVVTSATRMTKGGRKKRRGGANTELTGFSMSSSALFRNKGLQFLDDKFEQMSKKFEEESDEEEYQEFDMKNQRPDFEAALDDFLDNYVVEGKKMFKKH